MFSHALLKRGGTRDASLCLSSAWTDGVFPRPFKVGGYTQCRSPPRSWRHHSVRYRKGASRLYTSAIVALAGSSSLPRRCSSLGSTLLLALSFLFLNLKTSVPGWSNFQLPAFCWDSTLLSNSPQATQSVIPSLHIIY